MRAFQLPLNDAFVSAAAAKMQVTTEEARAMCLREYDCEVWLNDIYQVRVDRNGPPVNDTIRLVHINVRRRDGKPIFRDWRHFQLIKDQLVGEECEAVELYPAQSRLVDSTNKYHLWAVPDATFRFPFGFDTRDVSDASIGAPPGLRQRKLG